MVEKSAPLGGLMKEGRKRSSADPFLSSSTSNRALFLKWSNLNLMFLSAILAKLRKYGHDARDCCRLHDSSSTSTVQENTQNKIWRNSLDWKRYSHTHNHTLRWRKFTLLQPFEQNYFSAIFFSTASLPQFEFLDCISLIIVVIGTFKPS